MSKFETIIDFGSKNLRLEIYNEKLKSVYSSVQKINGLDNLNKEKSLNRLIRNAEKYLSTHIDNVITLYDSPGFHSLDISIKKNFDQPTEIEMVYNNLIEEANFIISENNYKDKIIHLKVNNIIADEEKKIDIINKKLKIKSLILEIKFICINKNLIKDVYNIFKKNNLNILNLYCSTYVKTFFYKKRFKNKNNLAFLDIGFNKSCGIILNKNKCEFFNTIPIGGNAVTKDISNVLKLDFDYSEQLKVYLNKNENSSNLNDNIANNTNLFKEISVKNISLELLKKIIEARIEELIELSIDTKNFNQHSDFFEKPYLIFIGGGSKLLSNSYNLNKKKTFLEIFFLNEDDSMICESGLNYFKSAESLHTQTKKKPKKYGIFETFFNLFSK